MKTQDKQAIQESIKLLQAKSIDEEQFLSLMGGIMEFAFEDELGDDGLGANV